MSGFGPDGRASTTIKLWDRLQGERLTTMTHWQEVANYVTPDRADYITHRSPGVKRMQWVYDSTQIYACEQLANGLHGLLTSPTLMWFSLSSGSDKIDADDQCARWLDDCASVLYRRFNGPKYNFASQSFELYLDLGSIGTACMAVLESPRTDVLFSTKGMRECVIAENEEDRIDLLCRRWYWTAKQAHERWGDAAGAKIAKAVADGKEGTRFPFLHMVRPRAVRDPQRSEARHKAFESVYVSQDDMTVISEGGFDEFPYLVPRFSKSTGETYGRSPGMRTLPDIKMLQEMMKLVLKAAQKAVDPPINVPDDGYLAPINTTPGGRNFYRAGSKDRVEPFPQDINVQIGVEQITRVQTAIDKGFYAPWLSMPSDPADPAAAGKGVTATYTLQQRDEKMRLLSPMLARMQAEFLGPLIDRTFAILMRRSIALRFGPGSPFSMPPAKLAGAQLHASYTSPIAVAQKASQLDSISRLVQTALSLAQIDPETPKILDAEAILRMTARDLATPAAALKSPQQVAAEAQQAQQAAAAQQQSEALGNVAGALKDGSQAVQNIASAGGAIGGSGAVTGQTTPAAAAA